MLKSPGVSELRDPELPEVYFVYLCFLFLKQTTPTINTISTTPPTTTPTIKPVLLSRLAIVQELFYIYWVLSV